MILEDRSVSSGRACAATSMQIPLPHSTDNRATGTHLPSPSRPLRAPLKCDRDDPIHAARKTKIFERRSTTKRKKKENVP